jgi:clan AA aspartic protease
MAQPCRSSLSLIRVLRITFAYLTEAVNLLRLPFLYNLPANLADNSSVVLPVHQATILWDGAERDVRVFATGRRPLIGTALLDEQELVIQFTESGLVTIDEL